MSGKAIVIGAGIAGIASAIELASKGYEVVVFEANAYPGGKLHTQKVQGFRFDLGPSLFTMPWLVNRLFELFGRNPSDYFQYSKQKTICNYFWDDGTTFTAYADVTKFIEEAANTFNEKPDKINKYLAKL